MYAAYYDYAKEHNIEIISRQLFCDILEEKKISIFKPRKDQCDICCGFETGNVEITEYENHILKVREAEMAKEEAKNNCNQTRVVVTMDVQSILLCPRFLVSSAYYKRKLQVHNFTMFRLNDKHVSLYVWHEGNGGVTSNEFVSCVIDYIESLPPDVKEVILISDGCSYQNRNKILSSSLRDLSYRRNIVIEQIILERSHTMMECYCIYSILDQVFKGSLIDDPSDYVALMRQARRKQPFDIKLVDYQFFSQLRRAAIKYSILKTW